MRASFSMYRTPTVIHGAFCLLDYLIDFLFFFVWFLDFWIFGIFLHLHAVAEINTLKDTKRVVQRRGRGSRTRT